MMNNIKTAVNTQKTVAAVVLMMAAPLVLADGFNEGVQLATKIRTGVYSIVGVICGLVMLWFFVQAKSGRKTWGDFFETCFYVVGAGASIAFATYLFTKGGSMSF